MALSAISWLGNCVYVCAPMWMCMWDRESELSPGDGGRGRCLSSYSSVVVLWGIALRVWCIHCCWNWLPNAHMLKCAHTHFLAHGALCSLLLLPLMKRREVSRGMGGGGDLLYVRSWGSRSPDVLEIDKMVSNHITVLCRVLKTCQLQTLFQYVLWVSELMTSKQRDALYSPM